MSNNIKTSENPIAIVSEVYQYLDNLFEQECDSDTLFAGGYLRGVFSLVATEYGDEKQLISDELILKVSEQLDKTKVELSPQDYAIVNNFWLALQKSITIKK